jgi:putative membrane protein insertion efficiency factor
VKCSSVLFLEHRVLRSLLLFAIVGVLVLNARGVALGGIHFYQQHLSAMAARAGYRCRFTPTCSRYAEVVIARDGVMRGGWKAVRRIARCGPWTPQGTHEDP